MATLTSNISSVNLTVSGNTQQNTNISWTLPSVPSGGVVSSCVLTGKATASMTKGSATIKVNGTTVTSGNSFSINLGTSNTTSSVSATAVGGNKNAKGTVTFSDLVYTVTYTLNHTVTFVDYDGTVLKTETVERGKSATAPSNPSRIDYVFIGWSEDFSNITSDITIIAQYTALALKLKENGDWTSIGKIFKKISGKWVEQNYVKCEELFSVDTKYLQKTIPIPTAILYSDGTFVFSNNSEADDSYGDIVASYTGWDTEIYETYNNLPWYSNLKNIKKYTLTM